MPARSEGECRLFFGGTWLSLTQRCCSLFSSLSSYCLNGTAKYCPPGSYGTAKLQVSGGAWRSRTAVLLHVSPLAQVQLSSCSSCPFNTYGAYQGASGATACLPCPPRTYTSSQGSSQCAWLPVNADNVSIVSYGTSTSLRVTPCANGTFSVPGPFGSGCIALPDAWYVSVSNDATVDVQVRSNSRRSVRK